MVELSLKDRFYSKFKINSKTGCWEWIKYTNHKHYPKFKVSEKSVSAGRVSYEMHIGEIGKGFYIGNKCYNRRCVNPDHLVMSKKHLEKVVPLSDRFYSRVTIPNESGCMEWIGAMSDDGYGIMSIKKKVWRAAHRYSYELFVGKIPDGMYVCHKCDNRKCIAPDHLFIGDNKDNMSDMSNKNRAYMKKGEDHPFSKLTNKETREIREMLSRGIPQSTIAKQFNVHQSNISYINRGKTRKEIL